MYNSAPLSKYLDDLAGKLPAPGGGSAAAAAGALGVAALSMVANLTIGKEKYKAVEAEMADILKETEEIRANLQKLVDEDVTAYKQVSAAYGMPKNTDEEKKARSSAIQAALKEAMKVPLASCRNLFSAIRLCEPLLERGNTNLVSDVGVGVELIAAAFTASVLNVQVNLVQIKDEQMVNEITKELYTSQRTVEMIREKTIQSVRGKIG